MKKLISLVVKDNNLKAIEIVKKGNRFLLSYIKDKQDFISKYKKPPSNVAVTLICPVFIKSLSLKKEVQKNKEKLRGVISKNLAFSLKEAYWDYSYLADKLTFFVVKSKDVEEVFSFLNSLGLKPTFLTSKASALYNYFIFNYQDSKDFSLLYLERNSFSFLAFQKGKFFFSEIPFHHSDVLKTLEIVASELTRLRDYLRSKGFFTSEVFPPLFVCGRREEVFLNRLSKSLACPVIFLEPKNNIHLEENLAFEPELVLLLGTGLGLFQSELLRINFFKEKAQREKLKILKRRFQKLGLSLGIFIFIGLFAGSIFLIRSIFKNTQVLRAKEEVSKKILPVYKNLISQKERLRRYIEPLKKKVSQNKFLIEVIDVIGNSLGELELLSFNFSVEDSKVEVLLKAKSYEEVSSFLRKLRETGYFKEIKPLSSYLQREGKEEFIYFRIRALGN
ncbi:MAG TPA: hypothetical protein ENI31_01720 [Candidatus Omnitrophica bacterium]|nr:MAG: hypothetical protein DRP61_03470 [Candidatus Omnitrophota bacterium]RKY33970.1 MAG: hypothetical protein DRP69_05675 [Candidatus Omnitrophota bacterium]RKY43194.1 MAG: hypothetical protein DRP80_05875 [Candidatus Omnitrophota bacterium]HEC68994.1 hypothetical protein [Candidatus Omnitrophota bacterium]